ncbi:MAG: TetR/AcrR family transcriptional regulator [Aureispira sp.]
MARLKEFNEIEVLDKAVELFWSKGYNATSANDLVKGLGLSRSSIYSTFKDKRTLFIRVLDRYKEQNVGQMLQMIEQSDDILKTIAHIFRLVIAQDITAKIPKGCLMVNTGIELAPHDQEIATIIQENMQNIVHIFKIAIEKGQALGQIPKQHSADSLARFIYNNISGLRVAVKVSHDKNLLEDIANMCLSILQ